MAKNGRARRSRTAAEREPGERRTARAMWKGSLELGAQNVPVKLYAAVEDRDVHFRLLHRGDGLPVQQRWVHPRSGDEVPAGEIRRGLAVDDGVFVLLRPEDLEALEPQPSREIEVAHFVPHAAIDPSWYERPYFLGPDGSDADYFALAAALRESERVGIAHWVMRGKRYRGALEARGPHLALVALRNQNESVANLPLVPPEGPPLADAERALAEQLISALDAPFDPAALRNEYADRVRALLAAKAKGQRYAVEEPAAPPPATADLAAALRRSLRAAKKSARKERHHAA